MRAAKLDLDRATWLLLLALALTWAAVSWRNAWVCDDAFITFRSVEQLHAGNGPRWNAHARVQAFTHPLWFGVLSTARIVSSSPWWNAVVLCFLLSTAALGLLGRRLLERKLSLILLVALALSSKAFVDYSSGGLENALVFALLAVFLALLDDQTRTPPAAIKLTRLILVGSLLLLCRHDLLLIVAPPIAALAWRARGLRLKKLARVFVVGTSPFLAWTAFSLFYYGFPFPNTAYAKLNTGVGPAQLWRQGLAYFENALRWDPVTAIVCIAGIVLLLRTRRPAFIALGAGSVFHLLYIAKVGGDFMAGRFLTPVFFIGLATVALHSKQWPRRGTITALTALFLLSLVLPGYRPFLDVEQGFRSYLSKEKGERGIADEKRVWTGRGSFRGVERYLQGQSWIFEGGAAHRQGIPVVHTAVGWDGFHAGLETKIIDVYALADPLLARLPARGSWRIGHFARDIPQGYPETLATGQNRILNPQLQRLYEHLRRVTEGPLLDLGRFRSIVYLNFFYQRPECTAPPCRNLRTRMLDMSVREKVFDLGIGAIEKIEIKPLEEVTGETAGADEAAEYVVSVTGWMPDQAADVLLISELPIKKSLILNAWHEGVVESSDGRYGPLAGVQINALFDDQLSARKAARNACVVARLKKGGKAGKWLLIPRADGRCQELIRD